MNITNPFLWLIIPSIIFEELFEKHFPYIADNKILNFIFAVVFWLLIATLINLTYKKLTNKK